MDNKICTSVYMPVLEKRIDVFIPVDKKVNEILLMIKSIIPELSLGYYQNNMPYLYNKLSGIAYDLNTSILLCNIKNGTKLVLI